MEQKNLKGKYVKLILIDGENHYSKKTGQVVDSTDTHIVLNTEKGIEYLLLSKILRIEVENDCI